MNVRILLGLLVICNLAFAETAPPTPSEPNNGEQAKDASKANENAESERTDEMLEKMRAAIEEIAGSYGDPPFIQIFTNEPKEAEAMRRELKVPDGDKDVRAQLSAMKKERDALKAELARREKDAKGLEEKIQIRDRQLGEVAAAINQARSLLANQAN